MTVTLYRKSNAGQTPIMNAAGNVIDERMFREFRRGGATHVVLHPDQIEGLFGVPDKPNGQFVYEVDTLGVVPNTHVARTEALVFKEKTLVAKIVGLWTAPEPSPVESAKK